MRELLTVTLNSKQVREACVKWARERTLLRDDATFDIEGIEDGCVVRVIARKKRVRKTNNEASA